MGVTCDDIREPLSARLDAEPAEIPVRAVDDHLTGCAGCRSWNQSAVELHRRTRLAPAPVVIDRSAEILARVAAEQPPVSRRSRPTRVALAALALAQLAMSGPVLLLGHDHMAPIHVAHEVGSFDAALAIGLLLAALRPRLAAGMLPLVAAITGLLILTAGSDLAAGRTLLADEAPHLLDVVGLLLIIRLWSATGGGRPGLRRQLPRPTTPQRTAPGAG